jgi:hypothetical protein
MLKCCALLYMFLRLQNLTLEFSGSMQSPKEILGSYLYTTF